MTRLSAAGLLLVAAGLGLLVFAPVTRSCTTDYDLTLCELTTNAVFNVVSLTVIALGGVLAVVGLPRRPPAEGAGQEHRTS